MKHQSPEEIERDINGTREHIIQIVDVMEAKVSPRRLVEHAVDYARGAGSAGGDFGRNLGRTVRDNPVPAVLVGVGLSWLMASGRPDADGGAASDTASGVGAMDRPATTVRDAASDAGRQVRSGVRSASQRLSEYGDRMRDTAGTVERRSVDFVREHPLAVAAAAVGIGALFAALLPQGRRESDVLGPAAERTKESVREVAREASDATADVASRAGHGAAESAHLREEDRDESAGAERTAAAVADAAGREARKPEKAEKAERPSEPETEPPSKPGSGQATPLRAR